MHLSETAKRLINELYPTVYARRLTETFESIPGVCSILAINLVYDNFSTMMTVMDKKSFLLAGFACRLGQGTELESMIVAMLYSGYSKEDILNITSGLMPVTGIGYAKVNLNKIHEAFAIWDSIT